jgi:hypothetical protein
MDSSPELLSAFFDEARLTLEPWVRAGNGSWTLRLIDDESNQSGDAIDVGRTTSFFMASAEFQVAGVVGELWFGDREFEVGATASPFGRPERHGLWEWADAIERSELVPRAMAFVYQADRMRSLVRQLASAIQALAPVIAAGTPDILARMATARAKVQSELDARWRKAEHRGTVMVANEAFRVQNWPRVIELLSSIADPLTPAEAAKLEYARRHTIPG